MAEINAGTSGSGPEYLIVFDGCLYFSANDGVNGKELWKYCNITSAKSDNMNKIISIYPNPVNTSFKTEGMEAGVIDIINSSGQIVDRLEINDNTTTIDISKLSKGIYFLRIQSDGKIQMKKFIKE